MGFQIGIKDIIDIILVAILLYETYKLLKSSGAVNVFLGIFTFSIAWFLVSYVFKMELLGAIFDRVVSVGAIALIIIFQDEIRTFFSRIGTRSNWRVFHQLTNKFKSQSAQAEIDQSVVQIVIACKNMAKTKTGALIIIEQDQSLRQYEQSGEALDAIISNRLIENIFFKNTPLHDGALIISKGRLNAAACILPVSKNPNVPKRLGLRHRSALGIAEKTDAIAIIVSEETGKISYAVNEKIYVGVKPEELEKVLSEKMTKA